MYSGATRGVSFDRAESEIDGGLKIETMEGAVDAHMKGNRSFYVCLHRRVERKVLGL